MQFNKIKNVPSMYGGMLLVFRAAFPVIWRQIDGGRVEQTNSELQTLVSFIKL